MTLGLMAVHAHPDDECITTGGTLRQAADRGYRTAVVTCTGGELGEIVGEGLDPDEVRPRLGELRRTELARALEILGAGEPRYLGYRDSGMVGTEGNDDPRSFWRAGFDDAVGRVVAQIRGFRPDVVVGYDAFGGYGHPDHVQAHRVALVAVEAASIAQLYPDAGPVWRPRKSYLATIPRSAIATLNAQLADQGLPSPFGEETDPAALDVGTPDEEVHAAVDVTAQLGAKMAALRAHYSQVGDDSFFFNMPPELERVSFGVEHFIRQRTDVVVPTHEDDLFTGLDGGS